MRNGHIQLTSPFIEKYVSTQPKIESDIYDTIKRTCCQNTGFQPGEQVKKDLGSITENQPIVNTISVLLYQTPAH